MYMYDCWGGVRGGVRRSPPRVFRPRYFMCYYHVKQAKMLQVYMNMQEVPGTGTGACF